MNLPTFLKLAAIIGSVSISIFLYRIIKNILVTIFGFILPINPKKYGGDWVLITGATDGIGKEYAKNFAKKGMNVFLVSRNIKKLNSTADELRTLSKKFNQNVKTHVLAIDFSSKTDEIYEVLRAEVSKTGFEIGILVNNVGIGYPGPAIITEIENGENVVNDLCNVNMRAQVKVSRAILPQMVERKNGLVINISSLSGIINVPYS